MVTQAKGFVGGVKFARGDAGSPELFSILCSVFSISGLGQTNDQIDATTFCSAGTKEYIAGLADGSEMTIELNFRADSSTEQTAQLAMIQDVKNKAVRSFRLSADGDNDGIDEVVFDFQCTCISWTLNPSPSAKNSVSFGLKISGDILISTNA